MGCICTHIIHANTSTCRALMINMPGLIGLLIVCCMCGMVVFAQYKDCDPLTTRGIKKDQVYIRVSREGGREGHKARAYRYCVIYVVNNEINN